MDAVDLVVVGAGNRGADAYGHHARALGDEVRFVAVAEPDADRRDRFGRDHNIPTDRRFASWEDLVEAGRIADGAIIATPEHVHEAPTVAALELGYSVLVEKPLAPSLEACRRMVHAAQRHGSELHVSHVLRYTDFFSRLHELLETRAIGDLVTVEHRENVAYFHMAHSWVRGNWRNTASAGPMLLTKSCHDLDILYWNLGKAARVGSTGSLVEFRTEKMPVGAPERCTDGCPHERDCAFSAIKIYLNLEPVPELRGDDPDHPRPGWPITVLTSDLTMAGRRHALETGPYGRCVYRCDNDTVDHQIVHLEFEDGVDAALYMHGHSHEEGRTMRYDGTRGTIRGKFADKSELVLYEHGNPIPQPIALDAEIDGHGGGDLGVLRAFIRHLRAGSGMTTPAADALESHLLAFAAEEARATASTVDMRAFRERMLSADLDSATT